MNEIRIIFFYIGRNITTISEQILDRSLSSLGLLLEIYSCNLQMVFFSVLPLTIISVTQRQASRISCLHRTKYEREIVIGQIHKVARIMNEIKLFMRRIDLTIHRTENSVMTL